MTIDKETLARVAAHVDCACRHAQAARVYARRGTATQVERAVGGAATNADLARALLATRGVTPAGTSSGEIPYSLDHTGSLDAGETYRFADLAALDTPEARALLADVEALLPLAEAVDAHRAGAAPGGVPRGGGLFESLSLLALRMREEIDGPPGRE